MITLSLYVIIEDASFSNCNLNDLNYAENNETKTLSLQVETRGHQSIIKSFFNLLLMSIATRRICPQPAQVIFFSNFNGLNSNTDEYRMKPHSFFSIMPCRAYTGFSSIKEAQYSKPLHLPSSTITRLVLHEQRRHISCLFYIWHYRVPLKL